MKKLPLPLIKVPPAVKTRASRGNGPAHIAIPEQADACLGPHE
jgi:hypothetical protein